MPFDELKARLAVAWGEGDWELAAAGLAPMHDHLVAALAPQPGERWLDVATGAGATALRAARAGAVVTAQDLSPGMIEQARRRAQADGVPLRLEVGDAERLPYPVAAFDVVASAVGAILAPDHAAVAQGLARVCRPGGRLGLAAWRPGVRYFEVTKDFGPPPEPGAGDREDWGREAYAEQLLGDHFELRFEEGDAPFVGASGEELWERQLAAAGPIARLYASLPADEQRRFRETLVSYFESERRGDEIRAPARYLLILGTRR